VRIQQFCRRELRASFGILQSVTGAVESSRSDLQHRALQPDVLWLAREKLRVPVEDAIEGCRVRSHVNPVARPRETLGDVHDWDSDR
jgi:hypothetical protein